MRPKRPDSAKTHQTKQTIDSSEQSKRELNSSKFSQTFSSGVNSFHEKTDEFKQYVSQKDKDPKFKHLKSKLQTIQQKPTDKLKESKTSFKPFERKKQKTTDKNNKKVEQKPPAEELSLSRGFAEKNKQKMNSLKVTITQQKQEEKDDKNKPKIKFDSFKLNIPGQKKQHKENKTETKKQQNHINKENTSKPTTSNQQRKNKKTKQQMARQEQILSLQMYVNQVEARNMHNFPANYDQLLTVNPGGNMQDLQKINLNDFLADPTEEDYESIKKKIKVLDQQLQNDKLQQSIDLEQIIGGEDQQQEQSQKQRQQNEEEESFLGSMSTSELKKRNAFITQILAGKISKHQIDQIQEMNKSSMKMHKIQHDKQQQEEIQFPQINMVKRQTHRLLERNRIEASGQVYRDCDYLSEEHRKRLEQLLANDTIQSPFQFDDLNRMKYRRIDEGIRMYREMAQSEQTNDVLNQDSLPKDPQLRKEAQKHVIQSRMTSVNQRLTDINKIVVTKSKIQNLIKKYQHTRASPSYQSLCEQNRIKFDEQLKKIREAETMISNLTQRQNLDSIIEQIDMQYRQLEIQLKQMKEMDEKELTRMQKQRLRRKYRQIQEIENISKQYNDEIQQLQQLKNDVKEQLRMYDQIERLELPTMQCEGFKESQTLEDIDAWIIRKIQAKQEGQKKSH